MGNLNGTSSDEYVWNDTANINGLVFNGATGGEVSKMFPLPSSQEGANVPLCLNGGQPGRGVPDVAFNASWNSGYYPNYCAGAPDSGCPNPYNGNGTSAAAPLWAGLVALVNAALGYDVGYKIASSFHHRWRAPARPIRCLAGTCTAAAGSYLDGAPSRRART